MNLDDSVLLPILLFLPIFDWLVTGALIALAFHRPRIRFLTERAFIAFVVSLVATIYAAAALNTEMGFPWFDADMARLIVRLLIVILAAAPILWLVNFWRRRDDEQ